MNIGIDMARACYTKGFLNRMSGIIRLREEILEHRAGGAPEKHDAAVFDLLTDGSEYELPGKITAVFTDMEQIRVNGERITDKTVSDDEGISNEIENVKKGLAESVDFAEALVAAAKARAAWRQKDAELVRQFETELAAFIEEHKTHKRDCTNFEMERDANERRVAEERQREIDFARKQKSEAEERLRNLGA